MDIPLATDPSQVQDPGLNAGLYVGFIYKRLCECLKQPRLMIHHIKLSI